MIITNDSYYQLLTILGEPTLATFVGDTYSFRPVTVYGARPYAFTIYSGTLPGGLALNALTGEISGSPTTVETKIGIGLRVTDNNGNTFDFDAFDIVVTAVAVDTLTIGVVPPLLLGSVGESFSYVPILFNATGDFQVWSGLTDGYIPGVTLNTATGEILGTPTTVGNFEGIVLSVGDYSGDPESPTFIDSAGSTTFRIKIGAGQILNGYHLTEVFGDEFSTALSIYHVTDNPTGKWKTNYPFGGDGDPLPDASTSRNAPGEKQIYTDTTYLPAGNDPFSVTGGVLSIEAEANGSVSLLTYDPYPRINGIANHGYNAPLPYTSGLITSEKSHTQTYGFFEAVMRMPDVVGAWSMFWLWNENGDEITIADYVASQATRIYQSQRTTVPTFVDESYVSGVTAQDYHAYGVMWTATEIIWYIDRVERRRKSNAGLTRPMFLLANLAVGGGHSNLPENAAGFPASLDIKSIKAYTLS